MLRTKARDAWARGPSLPSMLTGRPITTARALSFDRAATSAAASSENFLRKMTGRGCAKEKLRSETARPIVLSPRSMPATCAARSEQGRQFFDCGDHGFPLTCMVGVLSFLQP